MSRDEAESQYTTAKTSVWWDIENCQVPHKVDPNCIAQNISSALFNLNYCGPISISAYGDTSQIPPAVQRALSSTGIALNHVPAEVKDAADKKILVDMLLWAVDYPPPANYLLISGDRDFSNALHQLRMRRYNILLAQPTQASAVLVAAANCVWLWTSLICGGSPLSDGEIVVYNTATCSRSENVFPSLSKSKSLSLVNQNISNTGWGANTKSKLVYVPKKIDQTTNITRTSSMPLASDNKTISTQLESTSVNSFKKPHEFFGAHDPVVSSTKILLDPSGDNDSATAITTTTSSLDISNHVYNQPQSGFAFSNLPHQKFHNNTSNGQIPSKHNVPDIGSLSISGQSNYSGDPRNSKQGAEQEFKSKVDSSNSTIPFVPERDTTHSIRPFYRDTLENKQYHFSNIFPPIGGQGIQQGCQPSSAYIQGLIGVILLALDTLKQEKIIPTETNIYDCIHYGDPKYRNIDVKQALGFAVQKQMVLLRKVGELPLYIGRMEKLWQCVNPIDMNVQQYPKSIWDAVQNFLTSTTGRSKIKASKCRYEAALILKNNCLQNLSLGEVLQILNMVINVKRWIISQPQPRWQPIGVTLAENS